MKTKALISFAVTSKLICVFVFVYAKRWFYHDAAQIICRISFAGEKVAQVCLFFVVVVVVVFVVCF